MGSQKWSCIFVWFGLQYLWEFLRIVDLLFQLDQDSGVGLGMIFVLGQVEKGDSQRTGILVVFEDYFCLLWEFYKSLFFEIIECNLKSFFLEYSIYKLYFYIYF